MEQLLNRIICLIVLLAVTTVVFLTLHGGQVAGRTIFVDDDAPPGGDGSVEEPFSSIQDAFDASESFDTIRVYAGVYYENIELNRSITLIGNGSEVTTIDGGGEEDVIKNLDGGQVNISGFMITNGDDGVHVTRGSVHLLKNDIQNNKGYGIYFWRNGSAFIENNRISNNENGIWIRHSDFEEIIGNEIHSNEKAGIYVLDSEGTIILNNSIHNNWDGIWLRMDNMRNEIIGNEIVDNQYGIVIADSIENVVKKNAIQRNTIGILLDDSENNSIVENPILMNERGIDHRGTSTNNSVHFNEIVGNIEHGIYSSNDLYWINATDNWWGDRSGPYHSDKNPDGKGDNVSDNVAIDPWESRSMTWFVDDDAPSGGDGSKEDPFTMIQDAINASKNGDTILVLEGIYYENLVVNRSISLQGGIQGPRRSMGMESIMSF